MDTINRRHEYWDDNKELCELKREIVPALLDRALTKKDREMELKFKIKVLSLIN